MLQITAAIAASFTPNLETTLILSVLISFDKEHNNIIYSESRNRKKAYCHDITRYCSPKGCAMTNEVWITQWSWCGFSAYFWMQDTLCQSSWRCVSPLARLYRGRLLWIRTGLGNFWQWPNFRGRGRYCDCQFRRYPWWSYGIRMPHVFPWFGEYSIQPSGAGSTSIYF